MELDDGTADAALLAAPGRSLLIFTSVGCATNHMPVWPASEDEGRSSAARAAGASGAGGAGWAATRATREIPASSTVVRS